MQHNIQSYHRFKVILLIFCVSEFAGAAQEMFDAFVVNPYDEQAVASAIAEVCFLLQNMFWQYFQQNHTRNCFQSFVVFYFLGIVFGDAAG